MNLRIPKRVLFPLPLIAQLFTSSASSSQTAGLQKVPNYVGSVVCSASQFITAYGSDDIQKAVRESLASGLSLKVRSIARSRSYSPAICPEEGGIVLNVEPLKEILNIDAEAQLVTVQPGIRIGDLQERLNKANLAFPVTPDYNGVSIAGAMGAGAHNSSLQIPTAVGDWVEEIKLVDGQGEIQILSGEALDAARVHLGLLGVIFELKIKVVPQFKLKRISLKANDGDIATAAIENVRQYAYAKIHWFPKQQTYILEALDKVPVSTPGDSFNSSWNTPAVAGVLGVLPFPVDVLNSSKTLQCTAEGIRVKTWASSYTAVDSATANPVGLSYNMIGGSCAEGSCAWDRGIKSRTIEASFKLKDLAAWTNDVKQIIDRRAGCFPLLGIYLRFSAPSKAFLGQAYGEETVMFEIHMPVTGTSTLESSSEVYDEIFQMTLGKYQGRPHWGKNTQPYFNRLGSQQFPKWEDFKRVQQSLDPQGIFKNPFWNSIEAGQDEPTFPGCGVKRECFCSQDSDCGKNARCESGVFFTDARICVKK